MIELRTTRPDTPLWRTTFGRSLFASVLVLLLTANVAEAQRTFGTLVLVEAAPPAAGPSPLSAQTPADWRFVEMVYAPLYVDSRGRTKPWLAQGMKPSNDGKTLTLTLKENAAWSNGRSVSALDVVYTYELARTGKWNNAWVDQLEPIASVKRASDGFDVVFELKRPVQRPERMLTVPLLPSGLHGPIDDPKRQRPLPTGVLGAGAYKPIKDGADTQLVVNPHSLFKPKISEIRIVDAGTREAAAEYVRVMGDAVTFDLTPEDAVIADEEHATQRLKRTRRRLVALAFNPDHEMLSDATFRSAVRSALDRGELFVRGERGRPSPAPVSAGSPDYPQGLKPPPRDAVEARRILWYSDWERDVTERYFSRVLEAGQTQHAAFTMLVDADDDQQMRRATLLRERLAEAGINLKLDARPHIQFVDRVQSREFPCALVAMDLEGLDPLRSLFHSKGGRNITNFSSRPVDAALDGSDRAKAIAAITRTAPMVFMGSYEETGAAGKNVRVQYLSGRGGMARVDRWQIR
jgi:ABC-type transport system substrate-binding protein